MSDAGGIGPCADASETPSGVPHPETRGWHRRRAAASDYWRLLKPRVMSLVVFTALVGLLVAPGEVVPLNGLVTILCIAAGGGASGALNMWWDADIDSRMRRTIDRPIPAGRIAPREALLLGLGLSGASVIALGLTANWASAGLLAFTIFFYAVIYTMWLKRTTPQNIVIGGAAGAFPPMIGWIAATGSPALEAVLMFAVIFLWTPPHFWSLALFVRSDYGNAGVPMLTVTHGHRTTRRHVLIYSALLAPVSVSLGFTPIGGPLYLVVAILMNAWLLKTAAVIAGRNEEQAEADGHSAEKEFFRFSLLYLFAHFGAILFEAVLL
jgi:protoheme IX farnesyltransferase